MLVIMENGFPFRQSGEGREGEKAVCSEGQHSGPGLVLNRLCRVRPGPRWDRLSPPQALSDSIQGLHCPPDSAWGRLRGQSFPDARCHGAYGHPPPQIPVCVPCRHPGPSERPGGAQPVTYAFTVTHPWNTSGVTGRRNARF